MGSFYTTIFLNQKDPADINKAAAVCQLDSDDKKYFSMLPVGQAIVKLQDRWTSPIHVQFPLINVNKGSPAISPHINTLIPRSPAASATCRINRVTAGFRGLYSPATCRFHNDFLAFLNLPTCIGCCSMDQMKTRKKSTIVRQVVDRL